MSNIYDQFDVAQTQGGNVYDQFDTPSGIEIAKAPDLMTQFEQGYAGTYGTPTFQSQNSPLYKTGSAVHGIVDIPKGIVQMIPQTIAGIVNPISNAITGGEQGGLTGNIAQQYGQEVVNTGKGMLQSLNTPYGAANFVGTGLLLHGVAKLPGILKASEALPVPIEITPEMNLKKAIDNAEPITQEARPLVEPQGNLPEIQGGNIYDQFDNQPSKLAEKVPYNQNVQQFKTLTYTENLPTNITPLDFQQHLQNITDNGALATQELTDNIHGNAISDNIITPEANIYDRFDNEPSNVRALRFEKPFQLDTSNVELPVNEPTLPALKGKLPSLGKATELEEPTPPIQEQRIENPDWNYERNGVLYKDEAAFKKANPQENVLINDKPLEIGNSAEDTRNAFSGDINGNKLVFSRIADQIRTLLPDAQDRAALTLYRDSKSYQKAGTNPILEKLLDIPEYTEAANRALQPNKQLLQADNLLNKLHDESGATGQKHGFLGDLSTDNDYINRLYQKEPTGTTANIYEKGLSQATGHAKQRTYNTIVDAIQNGKKPLTLDAADLTDVFGQEYSKTLANNKLVQSIRDNGIGLDIQEGKIPQGYTQLGKNNIAIPDALYNGLKSIIEPNFLNKIEAASKLNQLQGLAKTVQLSASLYHDFTMAMQWAYQNKWNPMATGEYINALKNVDKIVSTDDFNNLEHDFVQQTGMTPKLQANVDVLRKLSSDNPTLQKFLDAPGIKQAVELNEKHSQFLFDKMQRWMKVTDYGKKVSEWGNKNPNASLQEVTAAKRSIARQINSAYGGLNWEALGRTPTFLGVARMLTLAPDWTYSNFELGRLAAQNSAGGAIARAHIASALIGGGILTEAFNYMTTGHFTDKNEKGHELEAQISPGVYTSFLRGGIGDLTKLYSNVATGGLAGAGQFAQGKASPFVHGAMTALTNRNYFGQNISQNGSFGEGTDLNPYEKTGNYIQGVATAGSPIPLGIQGISKLPPNTNPLAAAAVSIGLAKVGKPSK